MTIQYFIRATIIETSKKKNNNIILCPNFFFSIHLIIRLPLYLSCNPLRELRPTVWEQRAIKHIQVTLNRNQCIQWAQACSHSAWLLLRNPDSRNCLANSSPDKLQRAHGQWNLGSVKTAVSDLLALSSSMCPRSPIWDLAACLSYFSHSEMNERYTHWHTVCATVARHWRGRNVCW